jgi:hypothetical protein
LHYKCTAPHLEEIGLFVTLIHPTMQLSCLSVWSGCIVHKITPCLRTQTSTLSNVLSFSSVLSLSLLLFFERILPFIRQEVLGLSVLRGELCKWSQGCAESEVGCR